MKYVLMSLSVATMLLGTSLVNLASAKAPAHEHPSHRGTFVSAADGKLVMTGRNGKSHTHAMAKDVKVTIDGKAATVAGLKKGMRVSVMTDKAGTATAVTTLAAKPTVTPTSTVPVTKAVPTTPASTTPATPAKPATK